MPTFMVSMNFTDQGIRTIKDAPKRVQAAPATSPKKWALRSSISILLLVITISWRFVVAHG